MLRDRFPLRLSLAGMVTLCAVGCGATPEQGRGGMDDDAGSPVADGAPQTTTYAPDAPGNASGESASPPTDDAATTTYAGDASRDASGGSPARGMEGGASDGMATPDATSAVAGATYTMLVTFYGWDDNSPPGNAIAYAKRDGYPTTHNVAGGAGSYADPLTLATDADELPVGTIVYLPFLEKYAVVEDDCVECDADWSAGMRWHVDVWMNSNGKESASALKACEDEWTHDATSVLIAPSATLPVSATPLFDPSTNACAPAP